VTHAPLSRMASLALVSLVAGAILAACGSSSSTSKTSPTAAGGGGARRTALTACLRKHGVTLPAGAGPGGGGAPGGAPPSGAPGAGGPGAPAGRFRAAFKACGASLPAGAAGAGFSRQGIMRYVSCVRQHGYALPSPNFSGKGSVFPASVRSNTKFQSANRTCQSLLRPSGSPGAPPGAQG
jgi:hypothetical protein